MVKIDVSNEIKAACPDFVGAAVFATVSNTLCNENLWVEIDRFCLDYKMSKELQDIKNNLPIKATRHIYRKLGKDPNRYRPSAEALCRRILRDIPLYQINTLVDLINLVSIKTGYSIGGFDRTKIEGDTLLLDVGTENDKFEAIGRGLLNIENLPVYRDNKGGIGTPTSDNERTKLEINTTQFVAVINGYSGMNGLQEAVDYMKSLLVEYTEAQFIQTTYF